MEKVSLLKRQSSQSSNPISIKIEEKGNNEYYILFFLILTFERSNIFENNEKPEKKVKIF